jgi:xanthine dehydrogenase molybdopterin-binding subunit B
VQSALFACVASVAAQRLQRPVLVRADLLHNAGKSINPAIDIGQVEGGFIQGMDWLTMEELW